MKQKIPYIPKPIALEACKIIISNHVEFIKREVDLLNIKKGAEAFSKSQIKILNMLGRKFAEITEIARIYNDLQEQKAKGVTYEDIKGKGSLSCD